MLIVWFIWWLVSISVALHIEDEEADIEELDVGDVNDWNSDLPESVRQELRKMKYQKEVLAGKATQDDPAEMVARMASGKSQMCFAVLRLDYAEKADKEEGSNGLAQSWQQLLMSGGATGVKLYAVDPDKIVFVIQDDDTLKTVQDFVLSYPDIVDYFEVNQKRIFAGGRSAPHVSDTVRKERTAALGWERRLSPDINQQKVTKPVEGSPKKKSPKKKKKQEL